MSPDDTLIFFSDSASRAEKGIEVARSSSNPQLLALNVRQLFKNRLISGLIQWRLGRNPIAQLAAAIDVVEANRSELNSPAYAIPFARAALVAFLIGREFKQPVREDSEFSDEDKLDFELARATPISGISASADRAINKLNHRDRTKLVAESYRVYFEIATNSTGDSIPTIVQRAESNYERRARDEYFQGGDQIEGGGRDNGLVVDFRLAVALLKAGIPARSIHAWTWGRTSL